ncbi:MAG: hypothetical protein ACXV2I_10655, partial [Actinomycetes bacterium]
MSDFVTRGAARRALAILAAGGLLTGGITAALPASAADQPAKPAASAQPDHPFKGGKAQKADKLGKRDRERLAAAQQTGDRQQTIMIVTKDGASDKVAKAIRDGGGHVRYQSAKLNYLSAVVRTSSVTKTADLADVLAVDLDETFKQPETVSRDSKGTRYTGPDASTPDNN